MENRKCSEKGCVIPPEAGRDLCAYHAEMFSFSESLTDDGVDWETTHEEDGGSSKSGKSALKIVIGGLDDWYWKKEKAEDKKLFANLRERALYSARRAANQCVICLTGPVEQATCPDCAARIARWRKGIEESRREKGLCTKCGRMGDGTTKHCGICLDKIRVYSKRIRSHRVSLGRCAQCDSEKNTATLLCSDCLAYYQQLYAGCRSQGLCTKCRRPSGDSPYCPACLKKRRQRQQRLNTRLRAECKAAGLCRECRRPKEDRMGLTCDACRAKRRMKRRSAARGGGLGGANATIKQCSV